MSASACPLLKYHKPLPKSVAKLLDQRAAANQDRREKAKVRARDVLCVCCGWRKARTTHEALKFKSQGGEASEQNSIGSCVLCHRLLQYHRIDIEGKHCGKRPTFRMPKEIAHLVKPKPSDSRRRIVVERD